MSAGNGQLIAWQIAYEIMTRSEEPLVFFMLHPGGEQYDCLAVLESDGERLSQKLLMTLNGSSIHHENTVLQQYQLLFRRDKAALFDRIAQRFGLRLSNEPVRQCAAMSYLMELAAMENIIVKPAWYDGSNHAMLEDAARDFPNYPNKYDQDFKKHIPWWLIIFKGDAIAMLNLESGMQITTGSLSYNVITGRDEAMKSLISHSLKDEFQSVIHETQQLLLDNDEWIKRYEGYALKITKNKEFIKGVRSSFREWSPLKIYLNTTSAQNANKSVGFELRYFGQTVAKFTGNENGRHTLSTAGYEDKNYRDFHCEHNLRGADWAGPEAAKFRKYFKERKGPRKAECNTGNEEHRIESLWLTEFSKSKEKVLPYVKPVMIGDVRFPMPTPISASNHKAVKYSGIRGGGIDILTRTGTGGRNTNLCIMELKDENKKTEPPKDAMKQAIAYATFIRELVRSEVGSAWWKLFGFGGKVPNLLVLYAVCVMPSNNCNDYSFKDMALDIDGDIVKLHYIYFTEENNEIKQVETTLIP